MDLTNADQNATGFFYIALVYCLESERKKIQIFYKIDLSTLETFHPPWLTTKKPIGYYIDPNPEEIEKHERTIEEFKKHFLNNSLTDITIICVRADDTSPVLIIDGCHRTIAILRAVKENPSVATKIRVRCILLTGEKIRQIDEYSHLTE
jgi:hypothetical protein